MGRYKKGLEYRGCDEDCFNCPYPDCLKPVSQIKLEVNMRTVLFGDCKGTSPTPKMYTLELGGYGGVRPNISRKFYV